MNIFLALFAVLIVSLLSFVGVFFLSFQKEKLNLVLIYFVSFAAGAFLGDVFFHLLPELMEEGWNLFLSVFIIGGIIVFLIIEKIVHWRHCHDLECIDHPKSLAVMNIVGDGVHNFIDGLVIGASFLVSIPVGVATSLAVIFHEIPQEIGDFGVLLYSGYSKKRAMFFNFLSATTAIFGTFIALILGIGSEVITQYLVAFAVGGFLYIAAADLIPEIQKEEALHKSYVQIGMFILGVVIMGALLLFE